MPRSSSSPPFHLHRQFIHLHPSLMFILLNILFSSFNISPSLTSKAQEAGISPARRGDANNSTQGFTFNVAMLLRFVLPPVVKPFATGVASGVLGLQAKLLVTVALLLARRPSCHLLKVAFLLGRGPGCHLGLASCEVATILSEEPPSCSTAISTWAFGCKTQFWTSFCFVFFVKPSNVGQVPSQD